MHAFLVTEPPEKYPPGPDTFYLLPEESLGIAEVRRLESFLAKKPLMGKHNVVVIVSAEKLTLPAQQALLKTLEEPPGDSRIYLVTDQPEQLLPTILSRVQLSDNSHVKALPSDDSLSRAGNILGSLLSVSPGGRLAVLDTYEFTRETALDFLDSLEFFLHRQLSLSAVRPPAGLYVLLAATRKYLKANVNVRLAMDNFALCL